MFELMKIGIPRQVGQDDGLYHTQQLDSIIRLLVFIVVLTFNQITDLGNDSLYLLMWNHLEETQDGVKVLSNVDQHMKRVWF